MLSSFVTDDLEMSNVNYCCLIFPPLRLIAPLFSMVEGYNARTILCQILETIAETKERKANSCLPLTHVNRKHSFYAEEICAR